MTLFEAIWRFGRGNHDQQQRVRRHAAGKVADSATGGDAGHVRAVPSWISPQRRGHRAASDIVLDLRTIVEGAISEGKRTRSRFVRLIPNANDARLPVLIEE